MVFLVVVVGVAAWISLGVWAMRSGDREKEKLLASLVGKRVTIRYSPMHTVFTVTGVVRRAKYGQVRLASGTEETVIYINFIREIEAEGVQLRGR